MGIGLPAWERDVLDVPVLAERLDVQDVGVGVGKGSRLATADAAPYREAV